MLTSKHTRFTAMAVKNYNAVHQKLSIQLNGFLDKIKKHAQEDLFV